MDSASVGVVIRTLNEAEHLARCIGALRSQRGSFDLDILVVDSGSTDGTVEVARAADVRVITIDPAEFDYSKSLNLGIQNVRGDFVVSISAHAIPVDDGWLEAMTAPFVDAAVVGVSSRQIPWPGAQWQEVRRLRDAFGKTRRVYTALDNVDPIFSNAASAFRRATWLEEPFTLPAAEDFDWARRMLASGYSIVYEPLAVVYHSHHETARALARRLIDIHRAHDAQTTPRTWLRTLRETGRMLRADGALALRLDEPLSRRLRHLGYVVRMSFFYVVDFPRVGTTAEFRRADADARR